MPSHAKHKKDSILSKKDNATSISASSDSTSLRPNGRATTRSAKKVSAIESPIHTVSTQTNSFAALANDDTDDDSKRVTPVSQPDVSSILVEHIDSMKTHIKSSNEELLSALCSMETEQSEGNALFRKFCESSDKRDRSLEESIGCSIDRSFKAGFSSFNNTLLEALKIQTYGLQKMFIENVREEPSNLPSSNVQLHHDKTDGHTSGDSHNESQVNSITEHVSDLISMSSWETKNDLQEQFLDATNEETIPTKILNIHTKKDDWEVDDRNLSVFALVAKPVVEEASPPTLKNKNCVPASCKIDKEDSSTIASKLHLCFDENGIDPCDKNERVCDKNEHTRIDCNENLITFNVTPPVTNDRCKNKIDMQIGLGYDANVTSFGGKITKFSGMLPVEIDLADFHLEPYFVTILQFKVAMHVIGVLPSIAEKIRQLRANILKNKIIKLILPSIAELILQLRANILKNII